MVMVQMPLSIKSIKSIATSYLWGEANFWMPQRSPSKQLDVDNSPPFFDIRPRGVVNPISKQQIFKSLRASDEDESFLINNSASYS